jgi:transposase
VRGEALLQQQNSPAKPRMNLGSGLAGLWTYSIPDHAGAFLDDWCRRVMRLRIKPMMAMAKSFRVHRNLILNYFRASKVFYSVVVEGLSSKAMVGMRRTYGNRSDDVLEVPLFHQLGAQPEPPMIHRFSS